MMEMRVSSHHMEPPWWRCGRHPRHGLLALRLLVVELATRQLAVTGQMTGSFSLGEPGGHTCDRDGERAMPKYSGIAWRPVTEAGGTVHCSKLVTALPNAQASLKTSYNVVNFLTGTTEVDLLAGAPRHAGGATCACLPHIFARDGAAAPAACRPAKASRYPHDTGTLQQSAPYQPGELGGYVAERAPSEVAG